MNRDERRRALNIEDPNNPLRIQAERELMEEQQRNRQAQVGGNRNDRPINQQRGQGALGQGAPEGLQQREVQVLVHRQQDAEEQEPQREAQVLVPREQGAEEQEPDDLHQEEQIEQMEEPIQQEEEAELRNEELEPEQVEDGLHVENEEAERDEMPAIRRIVEADEADEIQRVQSSNEGDAMERNGRQRRAPTPPRRGRAPRLQRPTHLDLHHPDGQRQNKYPRRDRWVQPEERRYQLYSDSGEYSEYRDYPDASRQNHRPQGNFYYQRRMGPEPMGTGLPKGPLHDTKPDNPADSGSDVKSLINMFIKMSDQGKSKLPTLDSLDAEKYLNFKSNAETQRQIFEWTDTQAKAQVLRAVTGPAAPLVRDLAPLVSATACPWADFMTRMDQIFVPLENSTLAIQQQRNAKQQENEAMSVWHARCKSLYVRAFPHAREDDKNLIYSFVNGLNTRKIREGILQQNPVTYTEALQKANIIYAAVVHSNPNAHDSGIHAMSTPQRAKPRFSYTSATGGAGYSNTGNQCYLCGKPGHQWRNCQMMLKCIRLMKSAKAAQQKSLSFKTRTGPQNTVNRRYPEVQRNNPRRIAALGEEEEKELVDHPEGESVEDEHETTDEFLSEDHKLFVESNKEFLATIGDLDIDEAEYFLGMGQPDPNPE